MLQHMIDELKAELRADMSALGQRVDSLGQRVDNMYTRLTAVEARYVIHDCHS